MADKWIRVRPCPTFREHWTADLMDGDAPVKWLGGSYPTIGAAVFDSRLSFGQLEVRVAPPRGSK